MNNITSRDWTGLCPVSNYKLDLFRLHCGLNQNNSSSEQQQQLLLLQQQQQNNSQQFISPQHLQLISPTTTNNYSSSSSSSNQQQQLIVQQNFPLDLLACCNNNGGNTSSILDFNLNNNNFDSTITQNNNLFGLDLNSIATNDSNNLISHINSSTGVIDQFNIQNQNSFCNTTAANSSVATTVLNNYPFDSASVRFLAAAAEISSSHQQQQKTNLNTDIQQQQQILIPTNSINYGGMFCSPTNNNTINVDVSSISNNYNLQQHYNNQIIQNQQCGEQNKQKNLFDTNSSLFNSNLISNQQQHIIVEETKQKQQQTSCPADNEISNTNITNVSYC
uniref:Uncharacterized protein n=1 Tax=Meloidogyne enterolobii TaxID=390850 RepID=A0A6V7WD11_MELEN|nr:unnamed protein product [Meloidogyne enterolobii]